MTPRPFGSTGLVVSPLGLGAGSLGDGALDEARAGALLNGVLDLGINVVDAARSYGLAEERIGRHLAHRRNEFVLSTKVGYGVEGVADWTGAAVTGGVERALRVMRTDRIDIVHLHSCPVDVLARGDVVIALENAVREGKIRVAAYSGDNEALRFAVESCRFGSLQTSFNVVDRASLGVIREAAARGGGVLAKRSLANVVWRDGQAPAEPDRRAYWERWNVMNASAILRGAGLSFGEACVRFAAYEAPVSACLVGSSRLEHIAEAARWIERGPLPDDVRRALDDAYESTWEGVV